MAVTRFIGVFSGKGGVGKTTIALNVATALTHGGRETVLVETDFTTPSVGVFLGAVAVPSTLNSVLNGGKNICDVAYLHRSGVKVILASLRLDDYNPDRLVYLQRSLRDLEGSVDIAIIDGASGIGAEVDAVFRSLDSIIVVTTPDLVAVTDALKTITRAEEVGCGVLGIIINQVRNDGFEMSQESITSLLRKNILGVVPFDPAVREAAWVKQPVVFSHPDAPVSHTIRSIAKQLA